MVTVLRTAIGRYPHTEALLSAAVTSDVLRLDFADIKPVNRAFAPMVREARFDVCEMAIATFLQAIAYGKPLVLLPVVLAARFQESALFCRADSDIRSPLNLAGRRVGVRAYSQTTGLWLRGTLADQFGIRPEDIRWVTFEDAHVAEYQDPDWIERAPAKADLLTMLRAGEIDAAIVGNDPPKDAAFRTVFSDIAAAGEAFRARYGFVPVNHLLTIRRELVEAQPDIAAELVRLFRDARAGNVSGDRSQAKTASAADIRASVTLAARFAAQQALLSRSLTDAEIWSGLPDVAWPE